MFGNKRLEERLSDMERELRKLEITLIARPEAEKLVESYNKKTSKGTLEVINSYGLFGSRIMGFCIVDSSRREYTTAQVRQLLLDIVLEEGE